MRQRFRFAVAASVLGILAVSIGACGDDEKSSTSSGTTATTPGKTTVKASLGEYFIKLDQLLVPAGSVQFDVSNDGKIEHEFVIIKTQPCARQASAEKRRSQRGCRIVPGRYPSVNARQTKTLEVTLKPGKYVLICNLPGHYKAGQYTGLDVK